MSFAGWKQARRDADKLSRELTDFFYPNKEEKNMSLRMDVVGLAQADEKHQKYIGIARLCKEADIDPPDEVLDYFGDSDKGYDREVLIPTYKVEFTSRPGYYIDVIIEDLPDGVYGIRAELAD